MPPAMKRALWLIVLAACGDDPQAEVVPPTEPLTIAGCEGIDHHPCEVALAECRDRIFAMASCLRGHQLGDVPATATSTLATAAGTPIAPQLETTFDLLNLWLPDSDRLTRSSTIGAVFQDSLRLLGLSLEALQDRELDFARYLSPELSPDQRRARRALLGGELRLHQARWAAAQLGRPLEELDLDKHFDSAREEAAMQILASSTPIYLAEALIDRWGARVAYHAWLDQRLPALLASPPQTTAYLFDSALELPATSTSTLGAWGLYLVTGDASAAAGWRSEELAYSEDGFTWTILFADEAPAASVEAILNDNFLGVEATLDGLELRVTGQRTRAR